MHNSGVGWKWPVHRERVKRSAEALARRLASSAQRADDYTMFNTLAASE
jgi:hypothetical protein